ncbi:hypothetical protein FGG08_003967 [Glutinoglossum americanum]|uniref:Uncharacterized protein n=1 Tax=Glutinoglossum americanum TaxID=1670608 RepID=A0A9P8HX92_9PEZI|nr:hypothetical protein FGG08_003967 [Glutinoglossum americanum]
MSVKEYFKLFLDPDYLKAAFMNDPDQAPGTINDVRNWFRDFFKALYDHMVCYFNELLPEGWEAESVEYVFSVPTTWKKGPVIENFEEIVKKAGFGLSENHTVTIGLSEAESAAIYTAMYPSEHCIVSHPEISMQTDGRPAANAKMVAYEKGDVLLVCDAGGGTTVGLPCESMRLIKLQSDSHIQDICVLEVVSAKDSPIELEQLSHVKGKPIGSVQIDNTFRCIAEKRLNLINRRLRLLDPPVVPKRAAREMTLGQFQHHKENCGTPLADVQVIPIRIPGLPADFSSDGADVNIEGGNMLFSKEDIERMFKEQIEGIIKLIDVQIRNLKRDHPFKEVADADMTPFWKSYIVLSGGLGSSMHVQERIRSNYNSGMKILVSKEPQLAVCKGLVVDRIHHAFAIRRCRASYGILFNEVKRNPLGGKKLLVNRIHWIVKKDEPIRMDTPMKCEFSRTVDLEKLENVWKDKVAISTLRNDRLPKHIRDGDAQVVRIIESDLRPFNLTPGVAGVREKSRRLGLRKPLLKVDYRVTVSIESAHLLFESWFGDERIGKVDVPVSWKYFPEEEEGEDDGDDEESQERLNGPLIRF